MKKKKELTRSRVDFFWFVKKIVKKIHGVKYP